MRSIAFVVTAVALLMPSIVMVGSAPQSAAPALGVLEGIVLDSVTGEAIPEAEIRVAGIDLAAYENLKAAFAAVQIAVPAPGNLSLDQFFRAVYDLTDSKVLSSNDRQKLTAAIDSFRSANNTRFDARESPFRGFSDAAGRFAIANLPPGRYTIRVQNEGYFAPESELLSIVPAGGTVRVTVRMTPGGVIAGRVTADGKPQSGVKVQAFRVIYQNGYPMMTSVASRNTDDRGEYRLFYLRPDEYLIAVTPQGTPQRPSMDITVPATPLAPALTDTPGVQPQRTFYPGTLDRSAAERVLVHAGREVVNIDIPVRTSRLYRVSGEIRVPAPPASQRMPPRIPVTVTSWLHDPNTPDDLANASMGVLLELAGDVLVGNFQANNVLPGIYDWRIAGSSVGMSNFLVDVRDADVQGLRFEIRPGVAVKGTMTVDGEAPGANKGYVGFQIDGVRMAPRFDVLADEKNGSFSIPNVPVGHLRAILGDGLPPNLYVDDVRAGGESVFDTGFEVGTVDPPSAAVLLRSGAAAISGAVIDDAGKTVVGAGVALVPLLSNRQNLARFHDTIADVDGKFSISSVAPGEYKLFAWPSALFSRAAYNAAFLSRFEEQGVPVTISGNAASLTVELTAISQQAQ
ncbi:MAG TPA: carboxypeptidase-like regulatory domain-containing protein [Terriglobia bacterium]|nr:carboxypeptidase-like regulatory domain-containing protein [Terriglobia bacterium]